MASDIGGNLGYQAYTLVVPTTSYGNITGLAFLDLNGNGTKEAGEPGIGNLTVFADYNKNGQLDPNEPSSNTTSNGQYTLSNVTAGNVVVREVLLGGQALTGNASAGFLNILLAPDTTQSLNLGNRNNSSLQSLPVLPVLFKPAVNANTSYVQNLYRAILGREADATGLSVWVNYLNAGGSRIVVATGFLTSPEFYGNLVDSYYKIYLGRSSDAAGKQAWISQLQAGLTSEQMTIQFLTSPEAASRYATNSSFVSILYQGFLGRIPSVSESDAWTLALNSGFLSRTQLIQTIMRSTESAGRLVDSLYNQFLHRVGDASGKQALVNGYHSGSVNALQLVNLFAGSPEFFSLSAAAVI